VYLLRSFCYVKERSPPTARGGGRGPTGKRRGRGGMSYRVASAAPPAAHPWRGGGDPTFLEVDGGWGGEDEKA